MNMAKQTDVNATANRSENATAKPAAARSASAPSTPAAHAAARSAAQAAERAFAWWRQRPARERRVMQVGAVLLLPTLLVFGAALPIAERIRQLESRQGTLDRQLVELRAMQAWMKAAPAPMASEDSASTGSTGPAGDLPARLEAELFAAPIGFKGKLQMADGGIDLTIEAASFDRLLPWIAQLAPREGLFPAEVQLKATPTAGVVGGRIRLHQEGR